MILHQKRKIFSLKLKSQHQQLKNGLGSATPQIWLKRDLNQAWKGSESTPTLLSGMYASKSSYVFLQTKSDAVWLDLVWINSSMSQIKLGQLSGPDLKVSVLDLEPNLIQLRLRALELLCVGFVLMTTTMKRWCRQQRWIWRVVSVDVDDTKSRLLQWHQQVWRGATRVDQATNSASGDDYVIVNEGSKSSNKADHIWKPWWATSQDLGCRNKPSDMGLVWWSYPDPGEVGPDKSKLLSTWQPNQSPFIYNLLFQKKKLKITWMTKFL